MKRTDGRQRRRLLVFWILTALLLCAAVTGACGGGEDPGDEAPMPAISWEPEVITRDTASVGVRAEVADTESLKDDYGLTILGSLEASPGYESAVSQVRPVCLDGTTVLPMPTSTSQEGLWEADCDLGWLADWLKQDICPISRAHFTVSDGKNEWPIDIPCSMEQDGEGEPKPSSPAEGEGDSEPDELLQVRVVPAQGWPGDTFQATVRGLQQGDKVVASLRRPDSAQTEPLVEAVAEDGGEITLPVVAPAGLAPGVYTVIVEVPETGAWGEASIELLERELPEATLEVDGLVVTRSEIRGGDGWEVWWTVTRDEQLVLTDCASGCESEADLVQFDMYEQPAGTYGIGLAVRDEDGAWVQICSPVIVVVEEAAPSESDACQVALRWHELVTAQDYDGAIALMDTREWIAQDFAEEREWYQQQYADRGVRFSEMECLNTWKSTYGELVVAFVTVQHTRDSHTLQEISAKIVDMALLDGSWRIRRIRAPVFKGGMPAPDLISPEEGITVKWGDIVEFRWTMYTVPPDTPRHPYAETFPWEFVADQCMPRLRIYGRNNSDEEWELLYERAHWAWAEGNEEAYYSIEIGGPELQGRFQYAWQVEYINGWFTQGSAQSDWRYFYGRTPDAP